MRRRTRRKKQTLKKRRQRGGQKCLYIGLAGGLGNKLFMYASGLVAQKITGTSLCITGDLKSPHSSNNYTHLFDGKHTTNGMDSAKEIMTGKLYDKWSKSDITYDSSDPSNIKLPPDYYQNYEVVSTIIDDSNKLTAIDVVKNMLLKNEFNKPKYDSIRQMNLKGSAFMHVRRGDFKTNLLWLLESPYYSQALRLLKNIEKIYICSDEIEWCKENDSLWKQATSTPIVYLEGKDELETLYYMILCEAGAIIPNSTFSAWGAMMGADKNPNSVIVYPSPWNPTDGGKPNAFSFPARWKMIERATLSK